MITRQKEPLNLESRFDQMNSFLTPPELLYIRCHFGIPQLQIESYKLRIDGAVRDPFTLTYKELTAMPAETHTATLECAGNGRVFLVPQAEGAQWELGAVGTAEWTGVPLRDLLERAGIEDDACELVLEGADCGKPKERPLPPGEISYARSLAREKALRPELLIAYRMNGREIHPAHGYPVRAIVPGHFGMASVKWLTRIQAVTQPFQGYWQTSDYAYWDYVDGKPVRRALGEIAVKSQISRPSPRESVPANETYIVCGAAWAGETDVSQVDISADSGQSWMRAEFIDPVRRYSWRRWECPWHTPDKPGPYTLMSRATASNGATQPDQHDKNFGSYTINHKLPVEVLVR